MVQQIVILKCSLSDADEVEAALIEVVTYVREHEPLTTDYRVLRSDCDEASVLFTTVEIFDGIALMDAHNASGAVGRFFERTEGLLLEAPTVTVSTEIARK